MTRYFNFDEFFPDLKNLKIFSNNFSNGFIKEEKSNRRIRDEVFCILMFFSKSPISGLCEKAIIALGFILKKYFYF